MREKRPRYDEAFKAQAVALYERTDRGMKEIAQSLGIPSSTLQYWYDRAMARRQGKPKVPATVTPLGAPAETSQQKLGRLERENSALKKKVDELTLDKEILKKAAAFFAKESM